MLFLTFNISHSYGASPVIWDHTPVTCHLTHVKAARFFPAIQAGTRFTYLGEMKG